LVAAAGAGFDPAVPRVPACRDLVAGAVELGVDAEAAGPSDRRLSVPPVSAAATAALVMSAELSPTRTALLPNRFRRSTMTLCLLGDDRAKRYREAAT
jgi:hypothetical protein